MMKMLFSLRLGSLIPSCLRLLLGLCLTHLSFFVVVVTGTSSQVRAEFIEEIGTLESIYESRARAVINTFLRPSEYTIVISAEMEQDEQKIKEYRDEVELQFIPGLPIPSDPAMMLATNKLHEMKGKVTLNLVLNSDVPVDKEALLKQVLLSKLHLDEQNGDSIVISRVTLPLDPDALPPKSQLLPDFSWKTWALILLLAFMVLAALVYWANHRKTNSQSGERPNLIPLDLSPSRQAPEKMFPSSENEEAQTPQPSSEVSEESKQEVPEFKMEDLILAREDFLFFATQYPVVSSRAIIDFMENDGESDVIRTFEFISWDVARKIFTGISAGVWGHLGTQVRARQEKPTQKQYFESVTKTYKQLLSTFLEAGGEKDEYNPFAFLFKLVFDERKRLLEGEPTITYAIISLYSSMKDLQLLMELAPPEVSKDIPSEIAKLEQLPESVLHSLVQKLKAKLSKLNEAPVFYKDGPSISARVLRSYTPLKEMEVFGKMKEEFPEEALKVRKVVLFFEDLIKVPQHIISVVLSLMDVEVISLCLYQAEDSLVQFILGALPSKKAQIVRRDIQNPPPHIDVADVAARRRELCQQVEKTLRTRKVLLKDLIEAETEDQGDQGQTEAA